MTDFFSDKNLDTKLFLVPTPIGNLSDITHRALEVFSEVDIILAEDTRTTGVLLNHYGIKKQLKSFHIHNEHKSVEQIVDQLLDGKSIALVSDAGTPGVADPGFLLVREAVNAGIRVECLPGPTALIPALVKSGFPMNRFLFEGFLPHKKGKKTKIESLLDSDVTTIFYESPHRILKTLDMMKELLEEDRRVSVSRELSKKHEETVTGKISEVFEYFDGQQVKGEIVLVVEAVK